MQRRGLWGPSRDNEGGERFQLTLRRVDGALELPDPFLVDTSLLELPLHLLVIRRREECPEAEQVALDRNEHLVDPRHQLDRTRHSHGRVQLIDLAVRLDTRMMLDDPAATEQSCLTRVAGLRVDAHPVNVRMRDRKPTPSTDRGSAR